MHENERLQARVSQLHDRLEAVLRQSLRIAASQQENPALQDTSAAHANALICFVLGRWHQFARSGFKRLPTEYWQAQSAWLLPPAEAWEADPRGCVWHRAHSPQSPRLPSSAFSPQSSVL